MGIHMNLWKSCAIESKETHGLSESIEINESMESIWKATESIRIAMESMEIYGNH